MKPMSPIGNVSALVLIAEVVSRIKELVYVVHGWGIVLNTHVTS